MAAPKHEKPKKESASAAQMHYPAYHVSRKQLKLFASQARTPEEKRLYTNNIRVHTGHTK